MDFIKGLLMGIPSERLSAEEALLKVEGNSVGQRKKTCKLFSVDEKMASLIVLKLRLVMVNVVVKYLKG